MTRKFPELLLEKTVFNDKFVCLKQRNMDITFTLNIEHPEDLTLLEQLAQRLRIKYHVKENKNEESVSATNLQLQVFKQMEILRMKLQTALVPPDVDISQLANEVNAA